MKKQIVRALALAMAAVMLLAAVGIADTYVSDSLSMDGPATEGAIVEETESLPEVEEPIETEELPEVEEPAETEELPEVEEPAEDEELPEVEEPVEAGELAEVEEPSEEELPLTEPFAFDSFSVKVTGDVVPGGTLNLEYDIRTQNTDGVEVEEFTVEATTALELTAVNMSDFDETGIDLELTVSDENDSENVAAVHVKGATAKNGFLYFGEEKLKMRLRALLPEEPGEYTIAFKFFDADDEELTEKKADYVLSLTIEAAEEEVTEEAAVNEEAAEVEAAEETVAEEETTEEEIPQAQLAIAVDGNLYNAKDGEVLTFHAIVNGLPEGTVYSIGWEIKRPGGDWEPIEGASGADLSVTAGKDTRGCAWRFYIELA